MLAAPTFAVAGLRSQGVGHTRAGWTRDEAGLTRDVVELAADGA